MIGFWPIEHQMQPLIDLLPVIAFFAAYYLTDFETAIAVIMVVMTLQVLVTRLVTGTVSKMLLISAGLVVGLGGISLLLQNDLIFKWKPTVVNWLFAAAFLGSYFIGDKTIVQRMMETSFSSHFDLSAKDWQRLNLMWIVFFVVSGLANIVVAYRFSEEIWVNFKLFGLLGLTLVFIIIQTVWLNRRAKSDAAEREKEI
jgi:intracellular septation protein